MHCLVHLLPTQDGVKCKLGWMIAPFIILALLLTGVLWYGHLKVACNGNCSTVGSLSRANLYSGILHNILLLTMQPNILCRPLLVKGKGELESEAWACKPLQLD